MAAEDTQPSAGEIAAFVHDHPGTWYLAHIYPLPRYAYSLASTIRGTEPAGAYQTASRVANGQARVYARYIGDNGEYDSETTDADLAAAEPMPGVDPDNPFPPTEPTGPTGPTDPIDPTVP